MSQAGARPFWAYAEGQVADVCTSPGEQPFPALSVSLAWVLLALALLRRREGAIRGCTSCFLLAGGLLAQGQDAPKLLPPGITAQDCGGAPEGPGQP